MTSTTTPTLQDLAVAVPSPSPSLSSSSVSPSPSSSLFVPSSPSPSSSSSVPSTLPATPKRATRQKKIDEEADNIDLVLLEELEKSPSNLDAVILKLQQLAKLSHLKVGEQVSYAWIMNHYSHIKTRKYKDPHPEVPPPIAPSAIRGFGREGSAAYAAEHRRRTLVRIPLTLHAQHPPSYSSSQHLLGSCSRLCCCPHPL